MSVKVLRNFKDNSSHGYVNLKTKNLAKKEVYAKTV